MPREAEERATRGWRGNEKKKGGGRSDSSESCYSGLNFQAPTQAPFQAQGW